MNRDVVAYYDALAPGYDEGRFANSYGRFIDHQERRLLRRWIKGSRILDLACGTGRLSNLASHGCDASPASIAIARRRLPQTQFSVADAEHLPYADQSFDTVTCFHLFMHLEPHVIGNIFVEAARVLAPGGRFISDVVSAARRNWSKPAPSKQTWHGATALNTQEFIDCGKNAGLSLRNMSGVVALPIHRLPHAWRMPLVGIDGHLANLWPALSSALVICFEKPAP